MEKGDDEGEKGKGELELKWDRHYCKGEVEARKGEEESRGRKGKGKGDKGIGTELGTAQINAITKPIISFVC